MLQTLFYIRPEAMGWLLAAWVLGSLALLGWLIRRQGFNADTRSYLPVLGMLGVVIGLVLPRLSESQGLPIRGYGMMLLAGVSGGVWLSVHRVRRMGVNTEIIFSLAFWVFLAGIIGARLFYVVQYWEDQYRPRTDQPLSEVLLAIVNLTKGGLVVYGAAIGAGLALAVFVRKHRLPGLALADLIAPSTMLGLALGRVGCFLNGCCFGGACDLPWAVEFPWGSPPHIQQAEDGQLYLHGLMVRGAPTDPAVITQVEPGSAADRQGLKLGERIVSVASSGPKKPVETRLGCASAAEVERFNAASQEMLVKTVEDAQLALRLVTGAGTEISIETSTRGEPVHWKLPGKPGHSRPIHPTQLYSALDAGLLCLLLLAWYPYRRRDGEVFFLLVALHPFTRFLLEQIRTDEQGKFGTGLSISQIVSLLMLVGAAGLWMYLRKRPRGSCWPPALAA